MFFVGEHEILHSLKNMLALKKVPYKFISCLHIYLVYKIMYRPPLSASLLVLTLLAATKVL